MSATMRMSAVPVWTPLKRPGLSPPTYSCVCPVATLSWAWEEGTGHQLDVEVLALELTHGVGDRDRRPVNSEGPKLSITTCVRSANGWGAGVPGPSVAPGDAPLSSLAERARASDRVWSDVVVVVAAACGDETDDRHHGHQRQR